MLVVPALKDLEAIPDTQDEILKARIKVDGTLEQLKEKKTSEADAQLCLHVEGRQSMGRSRVARCVRKHEVTEDP